MYKNPQVFIGTRISWRINTPLKESELELALRSDLFTDLLYTKVRKSIRIPIPSHKYTSREGICYQLLQWDREKQTDSPKIINHYFLHVATIQVSRQFLLQIHPIPSQFNYIST